MKAKNIVTYTYADEAGWYIDIVTNAEDECFESWIYYKDYAIKHFMFGMQYKHIAFIDFENLVLEQYHDYTGDYFDEVMVDG